MASRTATYSVVCPPPDAPPAAKLRYARLFRVTPVAAALYEGDFVLKITRRPGQRAARKRATSRKRR